MAERWTDRKRGFTGDIPSGSNELSFKNYLKASLGGTFISKMSQTEIDGSVAIIKSFGMYEKIIYKELDVQNLIDPVAVYVGPNSDFSDYSFDEINLGCKKYWKTTPQKVLDFTNKLLLVLPCPKRIFTVDELAMVKKFMTIPEGMTTSSRRLVIFSGNDSSIANQILTQLNSKMEFIDYYPAVDEGTYNLSGYIPWGTNGTSGTAWNGDDGRKTLFWLPAMIKSFIGIKKEYWNTALVKDLAGYGLAYDKITTLMPGYLAIAQGSIPDSWRTAYGPYVYNVNLKTNDVPFDSIFWGTDITPYPPAYIDFNYGTAGTYGTTGAEKKQQLLDWIDTNAAQMPLYYALSPDFTIGKGTNAVGQHNNFAETNTANSGSSGTNGHGAKQVWLGCICAYADSERIILAGFKPNWLTKLFAVNYNYVKTYYSTIFFSKWLIYGKLVLAPDMFNTDGKFIMSPPYLYSTEFWSFGGALPIQQ
ncbi:MAG: hypothetical protein LLG40_13355 [Deltaproteobacteria bacterium]|nr:hypothetical protein [Deltaproteobacteria bacterium]